MNYRQLGTSALSVSTICLGTSNFGGRVAAPAAAEILCRARDAGVNFLDTAPVYNGGEAEQICGQVLGAERSRWIVATKVSAAPSNEPGGGLDRARISASLTQSLRRLSTDHVDILYLHRHDARVPLEETIAAIADHIKSGQVRTFGLSNYAGWQIAEVVRLCDLSGVPRPVVAQPYYNMVTRGPEVEDLPACKHYGIGVVPYSALARGILTGKYAAGAQADTSTRAGQGDKRMLESVYFPEVLDFAEKVKHHALARGFTPTAFAIAWVLANRCVCSALIGANTIAQLEESLVADTLTLDAHDEEVIDRLNPPGHHPKAGHTDPAYPVRGRFPSLGRHPLD